MAAYYFETSALVKRYIHEIGTPWVQSLILPLQGNQIYIAQIAGVETIAAITLRVRRGDTSAADGSIAIADFRHDYLREYAKVRILAAVISEAMDLAEKDGLRGYDAIQLAAASHVQIERSLAGLPTLTFVSADKTLNAAAVAEGLAVDDPNLHP